MFRSLHPCLLLMILTTATTAAEPESPPTIGKPETVAHLASPEALVDHLLSIKPPKDGSKNTDLRNEERKEAEEAYKQAMAAWQKKLQQYKGRTVSWLLVVVDYKPADNGDGYDLQLQSTSDYPVTIQVGPGQQDLVETLEPESIVRATGVLQDYIFERLSKGDLFNDNDVVSARFGALLAPARVALAKPGATLPKAPTHGESTPATSGKPRPARKRLFPWLDHAEAVVFILDTSASMQPHLAAIGPTIVEAVRAMPAEKQFSVMLYSGSKLAARPARGLWPSGKEKAGLLAAFLKQARPGGRRTDPIPAVRRALRILDDESLAGKRRAVVLLTDGMVAMHTQVLKANLATRNADPKAAIHVHLRGEASKKLLARLQQIAEENNGTLRHENAAQR